jgi:hypothetical protein
MPSSSSITVRRLEAADIRLLRKLNTLFGRAFADPATLKDDPPDDAYVEDLLSREHIAVMAALKDEDLVDGLVAYTLDSSRRSGGNTTSMTLPSTKRIGGEGSQRRLSGTCAISRRSAEPGWSISRPTMATNRPSPCTKNSALVKKCCISTSPSMPSAPARFHDEADRRSKAKQETSKTPGPSTDWSSPGEIWGSAVLLDLLRRGKRVPQDIALISIREVELAPNFPVSISYVALPRYETGKAAAELALRCRVAKR